MKHLNVAELIAALNAIKDKTLLVSMEGCDCYTQAAGAGVVDDGDKSYVLIGNVEQYMGPHNPVWFKTIDVVQTDEGVKPT